jgi:peptidoglycan/LPS O-acetylase OafA/YrhL
VIPLALGIASISVAARWSGWNSVLLLARADGLALGALLAGLEARVGDDPRRRKGLALASLAALLVGIVAVWSLGGFTFLNEVARRGPTFLAYNVMFLGAVGLAVAETGRPALAWLRRRRLIRLGTVSYGLYLIHQIVFYVLGDVARAYGIPGRPAWLFLPAIVASLTLAALSYRWIEGPILGLKSRFPYAPGAGTRPRRPISHRPELLGTLSPAGTTGAGRRLA